MNGQRSQQMFNSGERDGGVEHLVHMTKLAGTKSVLERQGAQRQPHPMSDAMSMKLHRRNIETERKIREGNTILLEKIRRVQSDEERKARHSTIVPQDQHQHRGFYQGSNQHARTLEAKRIDGENTHMIARLHDTKPFTTRNKLLEQDAKHKQLVNRISRFKPNPHFAGETILKPRRPHHTAPLNLDPDTRHLKEQGWGAVEQADVRAYHRKRDRLLRGEDPVVDPVEEERRERAKRQQERALQALPVSAPVKTSKSDPKPRPPPQKQQKSAGRTLKQESPPAKVSTTKAAKESSKPKSGPKAVENRDDETNEAKEGNTESEAAVPADAEAEDEETAAIRAIQGAMRTQIAQEETDSKQQQEQEETNEHGQEGEQNADPDEVQKEGQEGEDGNANKKDEASAVVPRAESPGANHGDEARSQHQAADENGDPHSSMDREGPQEQEDEPEHTNQVVDQVDASKEEPKRRSSSPEDADVQQEEAELTPGEEEDDEQPVEVTVAEEPREINKPGELPPPPRTPTPTQDEEDVAAPTSPTPTTPLKEKSEPEPDPISNEDATTVAQDDGEAAAEEEVDAGGVGGEGEGGGSPTSLEADREPHHDGQAEKEKEHSLSPTDEEE